MKQRQQNVPLNILLADDDSDDRSFFAKALKELSISTNLTTVNDGQHLMNYLSENSEQLPDILFLDINMPCKNGHECLCEIKQNEKLKDIPVVIFTTSSARARDINYGGGLLNTLFQNGANVFIRKPGDFDKLKHVISHALPMADDKIFNNGQLKYILNA